MRCLIRFLSRGAAGATESRERWFEGDTLTLGRGSDQAIYVRDRRVALEHARISRRGGDAVLVALTPSGVLLNGTVVREARLAPGDVIQLGENLLKVLPAPPAADLALSFELDPAVRVEAGGFQPAGLRLADHGLRLRSWSWLLFGLTLVLFLVVPATGLLDGDWQQQLRATVLPSDRAWTAGPLATVHAITAGSCEACHQRPFEPVTDGACLECHRPTLHRHAAAAVAAGAAVDRARCTDCHREHDGGAALVRRDDRTCTACHRNLQAVAGTRVTAGDADDFGTGHPPFRVTNRRVVRTGDTPPTAAFAVETQRAVPARAADFVDGSGLRFPHATHLDTAGVKGPEGTTVLGCADCHHADGQGGFRTITMERDCAACHRLDFDPADPDRTVPHGPVAAIAAMLAEYYSARYLEGFPGGLPGSSGRLRPAPPLSATDRALALERARERAAATTRDVVERRACATCHVVEATGPGNWLVQPVALTQTWLPAARFDHRRHDTTLTPCATCHAAAGSRDARDILMPTLGDCRACHAGSRVPADRRNRIASDCTTCHGFHQPAAPLWSEVVARSARTGP